MVNPLKFVGPERRGDTFSATPTLPADCSIPDSARAPATCSRLFSILSVQINNVSPGSSGASGRARTHRSSATSTRTDACSSISTQRKRDSIGFDV